MIPSDAAPNSDNNLTKDQLAEHGIESDPSGTDSRRSKSYQDDLAEEAKWPIPGAKTDTSRESAPVPVSEPEGENSAYYNAISP